MSVTPLKCRFHKFYNNDLTRETDTNSNANNKRLFSNRESRQLDRSSRISSHCDKRQRSGSWLLAPLNSRCDQPRRRSSNEKLLSNQCSKALPRVSRFLEGSMHNRVSQKPPKPYLDFDENSVEDCQIFNQDSLPENSSTNQFESRNSISKIRKSFSSTLNLGIKMFWPKDNDSKKNEENAKLKLMNERQEKAENLYKEYKKNGFFGNHESRTLVRPLCNHLVEKENSSPRSIKHDSGIELNEKRLTQVQVTEIKSRKTLREAESEKSKRRGIIFLDPPKYPYHDIHNEGKYPSSNIATHSNNSLCTPKPPRIKTSLINIRKAFTGVTSLPTQDDNFPRNSPTRKDFQKQQKLVKRVSNLEIKLSLARRQLAMASGVGIVEDDPFQETPSQERSMTVSRQLSSSEISCSKSETHNYQMEHNDQGRRKCRRAISFDASPRKVSIKIDTHDNLMKNRASSWNNKPLPSEPTYVNDPVTSRIDVDLLSHNVSYFSDSDSEEYKRYSKDRDFIQKSPHKPRKNKDGVPASKRKILLFLSREALQVSPLNHVAGKKLSLIKRLSKETSSDEKNFKINVDENTCPLSPRTDTQKNSTKDPTLKSQPCQSHSDQFCFSTQKINKSRPSSNHSDFSSFTTYSPVSNRTNLNQLNQKDIPSLPPPLQIKVPLIEDLEYSSYGNEITKSSSNLGGSIEDVCMNKKEVINFPITFDIILRT